MNRYASKLPKEIAGDVAKLHRAVKTASGLAKDLLGKAQKALYDVEDRYEKAEQAFVKAGNDRDDFNSSREGKALEEELRLAEFFLLSLKDGPVSRSLQMAERTMDDLAAGKRSRRAMVERVASRYLTTAK